MPPLKSMRIVQIFHLIVCKVKQGQAMVTSLFARSSMVSSTPFASSFRFSMYSVLSVSLHNHHQHLLWKVRPTCPTG